MTKRQRILLMSLGGTVCGGILGIVAGALLGTVYGTFIGDLSWGLDGALLGGGMGALAGAIYGMALGWPGDAGESQPHSPETRAARPTEVKEDRSWQPVLAHGPERLLVPENRHLGH